MDESRFYGEPWLTTQGRMHFYASELTHRFSDALDARLYVSRNETERDVLLPMLSGVSGNPLAVAAGLAVDRIAPRLSFFFACHQGFFEGFRNDHAPILAQQRCDHAKRRRYRRDPIRGYAAPSRQTAQRRQIALGRRLTE